MNEDTGVDRCSNSAIDTSTDIRLNWESGQTVAFQLLLQQGFQVPATVGQSIRAILCDQLGVSDDYLDDRINTIFLDGKPVDDVDSAIVPGGSTLALSASMPGLVGAAMRKAGPISGFRSGIRHVGDDRAVTSGKGTVTIKLYNLVVKELGPTFLKTGICLKDADLKSFFQDRASNFWSGCKSATIDGEDVAPEGLKDREWPTRGELVRLSVEVSA